MMPFCGEDVAPRGLPEWSGIPHPAGARGNRSSKHQGMPIGSADSFYMPKSANFDLIAIPMFPRLAWATPILVDLFCH